MEQVQGYNRAGRKAEDACSGFAESGLLEVG